MSALTRYGRPIDGTIPLTALLYDDEWILASQEAVGLYDGPKKSELHQSGCIHVTSHRLFFVAGAQSSSPVLAPLPTQERGASLALDLSHVSHTESYAGFWKSSPKVTLHLKPLEDDLRRASEDPGPSSRSTLITQVGANTNTSAVSNSNSRIGSTEVLEAADAGAFDVWECEICGFRNPPGLSPAARNACGLCGMPRSVSSTASPMPSSSSTPKPVISTPATELVSPIPITPSRSSSNSSHTRTITHAYSRSLPSSNINTPASWSLSSSPAITATPPSPSAKDDAVGKKKKRLSSIACPACTFLNHPSLKECEICGSNLKTSGTTQDSISQPHYTSKSAPSSRPASPDASDTASSYVDERERYIRLSFRKGGDKSFYATLKTALQQKVWEARDVTRWQTTTSPVGGNSGLSGISGILQNIDTNAAYAEQGMSNAFEDLEALMSKAQEMVRLAKGLNEQLTAASRNPSASGVQLEPEEATFVRSSLAQLGLNMKNTAITADMSSDEKKYAEQLALELAGVLEGDDGGEKVGMMKQRGIIGLDEVWGGWNRARGIALISPELTLKSLPYLPRHTHPPIHTRTLASGLRVLHTPAYSSASFSSRLLSYIFENGPRTTTQVAGEEGLSVGLVDELVKEAEDAGDICREDPMTGFNGRDGLGIEVRWWANAFIGYAWDGQSE